MAHPILIHIFGILGIFCVGLYYGSKGLAKKISAELKNFELSTSDEVHKLLSVIHKHI